MSADAPRADQPALVYDPATDAHCSGPAPEAAWVRELQALLPALQAQWQALGPPMLAAAERLVGGPLPRPATVRLTLCDTPSNALDGVTVNMRYALRTVTPTPVPLRYKVDTVFHELLHEGVRQRRPWVSALQWQHLAEPACVRHHLHLLALQKAVLLSLDDAAGLAQVVALDGALPSDCYRRAWALVNADPSSHAAWVAELRH